MVAQLVSENFRHANGSLARFVPVKVLIRSTLVEVASAVTDELGAVHIYLEPGQYDWLAVGATIPFDVVSGDGDPVPPFVHVQSTPSASWLINHNRGTKPDIVIVLDTDPTARVWSDVSYPDLNNAVVELPLAESGRAYIP